MAKRNDAKMLGPLYSPPKDNLGPETVSGPTGGKDVKDPLGYMHGKK